MYPEPPLHETTEYRTIDRLIRENCFHANRLIRWPDWLTWEALQDCVAGNWMERRNYGPATYGHVDYFLLD